MPHSIIIVKSERFSRSLKTKFEINALDFKKLKFIIIHKL
jgi:hypothetical protein